MANGATYNPDHSRRGEREQGIIAGPGAWPPVGLRPPVALIPKHKTIRGRLSRWLDDGESWWSVYAWEAFWTLMSGGISYEFRRNIPWWWQKDYHREERERWPEYKDAYDAYFEARATTPYQSQWRPSLRRREMLPPNG